MPEGERDTFAEFQNNTHPISDMLTLIRKPTSEVSPEDFDGPYDLVFLDADHSYALTKADFELVEPLVAPQGIVALHDAKSWEGVSRVVGEALSSRNWRMVGTVRELLWLSRADFRFGS
jgi:predicted O-methyltransferase YrrM